MRRSTLRCRAGAVSRQVGWRTAGLTFDKVHHALEERKVGWLRVVAGVFQARDAPSTLEPPA